MSVIRLVIAGATGRTGSMLVRQAARDPAFHLVAAVTRPDDPQLGADAGQVAGTEPLGVQITAECQTKADVLIEFTTPNGCKQWADWCGGNGVALVSGTTGLGAAEQAALRSAAKRIPAIWSPNMSLGVNLLLELVEAAAARLGAGWDIEICEVHHRHKLDAPSGTAQALLESVCRARGVEAAKVAVFGREGSCGPRRPGEIGVHALRLGENVGEHEILFASASEELRLHHRAVSREAFAAGALHAARWLAAQPAGLYTMHDVLAPRESAGKE